MLFTLAGAAIGGTLSYFASQEEQANVDRQKAMLEESKVGAGERFRKVHNLERRFNTDIANSQNQMALNTRGADASLTQSAAFGAGVGAKISAMGAMENAIDQGNRQITQQIAGISDVNTTADVISGGIEGGIAGAQIGELTGLNDLQWDFLDSGELTETPELGTTPEMNPTGINQARTALNQDLDINIQDDPVKTKITDTPLGGPKTTDIPMKPLNLDNNMRTGIDSLLPLGGAAQIIPEKGQSKSGGQLPGFYGAPSFGGASVIGNEASKKVADDVYEFGGDVLQGIGDAGSWIWNTLRRPR